jgi:hypothetical protein
MPPSAWSGREMSGRPQMDAVGVEDKPLLSDGQMGSHIPSAEPPSTQPTSSRQHPFYGHEQTSTLCARFITDLFACPQYPPSSSNSTVRLPHFIVHVLHRTKLHSSVTFAALVLFQRLKAHFPTARESSGHFLFVSAFILASEVICDDTYSNKSWFIVAQGMFQLWEINQMEREMCQYLECRSRPGSPKTRFRRTAGPGPGPYPTLPYLHPATDKEADAATHCQPFRSPIIYESIAVVRAAASFATQTITPLFKTPPGRT